MTRLILAVVFLVTACAPSALTVGVAPAGTGAATPSASPTSSVPSSPKPKPTPSVLALAEAYLVVADTYNRARTRLVNVNTRNWKLANFRAWCGDLVRITDAFVTGMTKIPFSSAAMKKDAAALIAEAKLEVKAFKRCAVAKSMTTVRKSAETADALTPKGTAAAQRLRRDLGLPTR